MAFVLNWLIYNMCKCITILILIMGLLISSVFGGECTGWCIVIGLTELIDLNGCFNWLVSYIFM